MKHATRYHKVPSKDAPRSEGDGNAHVRMGRAGRRALVLMGLMLCICLLGAWDAPGEAHYWPILNGYEPWEWEQGRYGYLIEYYYELFDQRHTAATFADINHDGEDELIAVDVSWNEYNYIIGDQQNVIIEHLPPFENDYQSDFGGYVYILYYEDGKSVRVQQAFQANGHNGYDRSISLISIDGKDYFLIHNPLCWQGECDYHYALFYLNEAGEPVVIDEDRWYINEHDITFFCDSLHRAFLYIMQQDAAYKSYAQKLNAYLAKAKLLVEGCYFPNFATEDFVYHYGYLQERPYAQYQKLGTTEVFGTDAPCLLELP